MQNLVAKAPSANLPAMLVAQLLPFVKNLSTRKWTDEDIVEDVQYLRDELTARFDSLTYVQAQKTLSPHYEQYSEISFYQDIRRIHLRTTLRPPIMVTCTRIRPLLERERH